MSRIIAIGTAVPQNRVKQDDLLDFMHSAYTRKDTSRKLSMLFRASGIHTRHSAVPDFGKDSPDRALFVSGKYPDVAERLRVFHDNAVSLALEAVHAAFRKPDPPGGHLPVSHLITVTCTGLQAPGLDAELMHRLGLANDIFHTAVNFLGCNAAFPALKMADMIAQTNENARILIVCIELCTLHFQPKSDHDNLLSNTIFSDGAAAMVLVPDRYAEKHKLKGLALKGFYSCLFREGQHLMGWNITPLAFEMVLNARVADLIEKQINPLIATAAEKLAIDPATVSHWAVHPGGRKILDVVRKKLEISDEKLSASYEVLYDYGNMSSATIVFVLEKVMAQLNNPGQLVIAIGFGPGISVDSACLTYEE
ncbi:MAG: type III polyketide synthase [Prolixibacteraceae bacterium]